MAMQSVAIEPSRMYAEAAEAGAAVARQIAATGTLMQRIGKTLRRLSPRVVVSVARGSSDHAATFAKYLIEAATGVPTASAAPSVVSLYGTQPRLEGALCLAISQSGRSPDLLATVDAARRGGAFVLVLVNDEDSPLAGMADELVPLCAGRERSVAATKSYIAALSAIVAMVAAWTQDRRLAEGVAALPEALEQAWGLDWSPLVETARPASSLYVIGRGIGLGVAREAALKLKETSRIHAEALSAAEIRHGPMALVRPGFPILVFRQSDPTGGSVDALVAALVDQRATVLAAGSSSPGIVELPIVRAHPVLEPILQIQAFYKAANALALARGLDPDRPAHLGKVTETL
jgi:glucosamine--fructose-6-phosphate aminotransferase (isomerizing)